MNYMKYLNVPYKFKGTDLNGLDCINLCVLMGKDNGTPVGFIDYEGIQLKDVYGVFAVNMANPNKYRETTAKPNVLAVFRVMGKVQHVGYMIDKYRFLHIMEGTRVSLESVKSPMWAKRVVGYYEYIGE
jgi:cell wall-associated NlpC family hydrolase